jgi:hypothetical protein
LIKKIASTLGENLDGLVVIYLSVSETYFSISILDVIAEAVTIRKLPLTIEDAKASLINIVESITINGKRLVLFVDEAQDLYPAMEQVIFDVDIDQRKINILNEIHAICSYNQTLTFVTGSSVRLSNFAYERISFPFMGKYPNLNDSRLPCFHLYPILIKEEFQRCLATLQLTTNVVEWYKKCGGSIGGLVSTKITSKLKKTFVIDELFFTTLQILYINTWNREEVDLFNRKYIGARELDEMLKETFDRSNSYLNLLDEWCDSGFLLKDEDAFSFLSTELLDFVQKRENQLSALEVLGLKYPEGRNVGEKIYESLIAEGICENMLGIPPQKLSTVKIIIKDNTWNIQDLYKAVMKNQKMMCKIGPDKFGQDFLVVIRNGKKVEFKHIQIKCGYSQNDLQKKEISLLENEKVANRYAKLVDEIAKQWGSGYILIHTKVLVTSKKVGSSLQNALK